MARPTHNVFLVTPYRDVSGQNRQCWSKVGVAFAHADGRGWSVHWHVHPSANDMTDGNIVMRDIDERGGSSRQEQQYEYDNDHEAVSDDHHDWVDQDFSE